MTAEALFHATQIIEHEGRCFEFDLDCAACPISDLCMHGHLDGGSLEATRLNRVEVAKRRMVADDKYGREE